MRDNSTTQMHNNFAVPFSAFQLPSEPNDELIPFVSSQEN